MNYVKALRDVIVGVDYAARKWATARLAGYLAGRGIHLSREWMVEGASGGPAIDELYVLVVVWEDGTESLVTGKFDDFWRYVITTTKEPMDTFVALERENNGVFAREPGPRMEVRRFDGHIGSSNGRFASGELVTVLREGPQ